MFGNVKKALTLFLLCISIFSIDACKKDNDTNNSPQLAFEKDSYYVEEIAQLVATNINITDTAYSGSINGMTVQLKRYSDSLVFIMPQLSPGDYQLSLSISGVDYQAPFKIIASVPVSDANAYVQDFINQTSTTASLINQYKDSLPPTDTAQLMNNVRTINGWLSSLTQQYNALDAAQKQECATFLAANKWWLDEVHNAMVDLATDVASYKTQDQVEDHEARVNASIQRFLLAKAKVLKHIPKIAFFTGAGAIVGSLVPGLTGVGAAIGAGLAIGNFLLDLQTLQYSIDDMLNIAFIPFDNLEMSGKRASSYVSFDNQVAKQVNVDFNYRSLYASDKTSGIAVVSSFVNGLVDIRGVWNLLVSLLPSSLSAPKIIDDVPAYNTHVYEVNSNYLTVAMASNNSVSVGNVDKTDGQLILTFNNNSTSSQSFTFTLTYTHPQLGTFTEYVNADITAGAPGANWTSATQYRGQFVKVGNTLFLASGGDGMFQSTDNGASWSPLASTLDNGSGGHIPAYDIIVSGGVIYVAAADGVHRSADGGASWTKSNNGLPATSATSYQVNSVAATSNAIFAAMDFDNNNNDGGGIYKSIDGGQTWALASAGLPYAGTDSGFTKIVAVNNYVIASEFGSTYVSNNGTGWSLVSFPSIYNGGNFAMAVASWGTVYSDCTANDGIYLSTTNGTSWQNSSTGLPASSNLNPYAFAFDNDTMYVDLKPDNWRKIYKSIDHGQTWSLAIDTVPSADPNIYDGGLIVSGNHLVISTVDGTFYHNIR